MRDSVAYPPQDLIHEPNYLNSSLTPMFSRLRRFLGLFLHRSRTINNTPLNRVSLIVILIIDLFILINVFIGLNDISQWHISPQTAYPCYYEWSNYRKQTDKDKDFNIIREAANENYSEFRQSYQQGAVDHLGSVNDLCLQYGDRQDAIRTAGHAAILKTVEQKQTSISALETDNQVIREQYDSTLLEEIAGQSRQQSINQVGAAQARQKLDQNTAKIKTLTAEIAALRKELIAKPESMAFLTFLQQEPTFQTVEQGYNRAAFWYPSIQLVFQAVFLVPLILIALVVYVVSDRHNYGLIALISWHLLVIFFVPLLLKLFEFLQVGVLFTVLLDIISVLLGRLLFLVSYIYILLIPLIGFGLIKLFQTFVFNPKLQAANRVQKLSCLQCAKKLHPQDSYCPHCGYYQFLECNHCHQLTYRYLSYCRHCGTAQGQQHLS